MNDYKDEENKPQTIIINPTEYEEEAPEDPKQIPQAVDIIHTIIDNSSSLNNFELISHAFNDLITVLKGNEQEVRISEKMGIYRIIYKMLVNAIPDQMDVVESLLIFTARLTGNEYSECSFFVNGTFYRLLIGLLSSKNLQHIILSIIANTTDDRFNRDAFLSVADLCAIQSVLEENSSQEQVLMSAARLMLGITQFDLEEIYIQKAFDISILLVNSSFNEVEYYGLYSIHYILMHQSKFVHIISANAKFITFITQKFEKEDIRIVEVSLNIIADIAACDEFAGNLLLEDLLPLMNSDEKRVALAAERCLKNLIVSSRLKLLGESNLLNMMNEIALFAREAHYFAKGSLINSLECVIRNLSTNQILSFVRAGIIEAVIECSSVTEKVPQRNFLMLMRRILKAACTLEAEELEIASTLVNQLADSGVFDEINDIYQSDDTDETTSQLAHDVLTAHADIMIVLEENGVIH